MNIVKTFAAALVLGSFGLAGCNSGPEGTYKLDKAEVKKGMEAEIAKMPADQQQFAKLGLAMIDAMDMTMDLQSGGKLKMKSTMPSFDKGKPAKTEEKDGTWKAEGDSLTLTADGKPLKCTKSGTKLSCDSDKASDPKLVFVKS